MFRSIFTRLFWTNFIIVTLVLVLAFTAVIGFLGYHVQKEKFSLCQKASKHIEYLTIVLHIETHDPMSRAVYDSTIASWAEFTDSDIAITDSQGNIFSTTTNINSVPSELLSKVLSGNTATEKSHFGSYYKRPVYVVGIPLYYSDRVIGAVYFNTPVNVLSSDTLDFVDIFLMSCAIALLVAFLLVFHQSKRISAPIKDINSAVNYIASGKFDKRVKVSSSDEIGQLASSFNYMADSLDKIHSTHTSFISDVSHELRTPMTSISGFVGGILDGTIPPEKHKEYLKIVYDESVRLTKLTNDMLQMSKMSSSEFKLDITDFDINELIRRCIIQSEQRISVKNLELEINFVPDSIKVLGDKDAIQRVVLNILDNAIKFSFENTKIIISTWYKDAKAYVSIGNFGTGIDIEDIPHIFDRFYKTDRSRTSDKRGAGLGLSMVRNIISLHKGQIWVDSTETKEGTGVKFTKFTFTLKLQ